MTSNEFNALAWRDFLLLAYVDPDTRSAFTRATGMELTRPASAIEQLLDNATGHRAETLERFVEWATETIWGLDDAPRAYREELANRREGRR
jgi:hypothetical protein